MTTKFSTYFTRNHKTTERDILKNNYQKSISRRGETKCTQNFFFFFFFLFGGLPSSTQCCMHMNMYRLTF